jgi:LysR family transcriptional regulator, glycine cleavage system transcriptional activator
MVHSPNRSARKARGHYQPKDAAAPKGPPAHKVLAEHPTRMPPLGTLRAFEAVARLRSVHLAAMELHVTPSAISQQVKALEADLGVKLVNRYGNTISLTEEGLRGRDQLSAGLRLLQQGVERMRLRPRMRRLRLTVEPAFAANWLIRRLPSYRALPDALDVLLDPSKEVVDIVGGGADIGIRFGNGRYPGLEAINLFEDEIFPVCSPDYAALHPIRGLEDLKNHHLLRIDWRISTRWPDWTEWLEAAGVRDEDDAVEAERRGTVIRDSSLLLAAALEGQGIALSQGSLVADLIKDKKLVAPFARRLKTGFGYHLVYPLGADQRPEIKVFRDWVVKEAKQE